MGDIEYIWHAKRYWTSSPTGDEPLGWNTDFQICLVLKKTAKRIFIKTPSIGDLQLDREAFDREGKVYHSKPHEWFYKVKPAVDPEKPGPGYYAFQARITGTYDALITLGLTAPCTQDEVRRAYRRLSKKAHPDTGGSHDEFLKLTKAYESAMTLCR